VSLVVTATQVRISPVGLFSRDLKGLAIIFYLLWSYEERND